MATTPNGLNIIYGAAGFSSIIARNAPSPGDDFHYHVKQTLGILSKEGISSLDAAEIYPGAEAEIGHQHAASHFALSTKIAGGYAEGRRNYEIIAYVFQSLRNMNTDQVDIVYIHAPDLTIPLEEQLSAINTLHNQKAFKRFGLSNFTAAQVQEVYDITQKNGWILPTVYQGNYNAIARVVEEDLFPTLRRLGMCFNAYSPIAGGFLAKTRAQIEAGAGRFDSSTPLGQLYGGLYNKTTLLDALEKWNEIAKDSGISTVEMAYRWVVHHSILSSTHGDGIIFGAHKADHLVGTIGYLKAGPLPAETAKRIDALWGSVKAESPQDNFHSKPDTEWYQS